MGLFDFLTSDIAIDLGTANTLIVYKDDIIVNEPSILAVNKATGKVLCIGRTAMQMHEKAHESVNTIRPLRDGAIANFTAAEQMIRGMIKLIDNKKRFFSSSYRMVVCIPGERSAEKIKMAIGSALSELDEPIDDYPVRGRDLMTGIPREIRVKYTEIAYSLDKSISKIEEGIMKALEVSPPELAADILKSGIYLTGGGALIRGLDKRIGQKTKLPIHIAADPLKAVGRGMGKVLKNLDLYKTILVS